MIASNVDSSIKQSTILIESIWVLAYEYFRMLEMDSNNLIVFDDIKMHFAAFFRLHFYELIHSTTHTHTLSRNIMHKDTRNRNCTGDSVVVGVHNVCHLKVLIKIPLQMILCVCVCVYVNYIVWAKMHTRRFDCRHQGY